MEKESDYIGDRYATSYYRTQRNLRDIVYNNTIPFKSHFLTLTFAKAPKSREECYMYFRKFTNRLYRNRIKMPYVGVIEKGTKNTKRWHWHLIVFSGIQEDYRNEYDKPKSKLIDKYWKYGWHDLAIIHTKNQEKLTGYLVKYLTKYETLEEKRLYFASFNLQRSRIIRDRSMVERIEKENKRIKEEAYSSRYQGQVIEVHYQK